MVNGLRISRDKEACKDLLPVQRRHAHTSISTASSSYNHSSSMHMICTTSSWKVGCSQAEADCPECQVSLLPRDSDWDWKLAKMLLPG